MISILHADYYGSLRGTCYRLGMFYSPKHVVRRIYRLIYRNMKTVNNVKALEVLSDGKGANQKLFFRIYFTGVYEECIEVPNDYILGRKIN